MKKQKILVRYDVTFGDQLWRKLVELEKLPSTTTPLLLGVLDTTTIECEFVEIKIAPLGSSAQHIIVWKIAKDIIEKERERAGVIGLLIDNCYNNPNASY